MENNMANTTFEQRLKEARQNLIQSNSDKRLISDIAINDALKRESLAKLSTLIKSVAEGLALDMEKIERRIAQARRSNYGRICEHINILASIYAWPVAERSQASEVVAQQEAMLDILASNGVVIEGDLLLDIKEAKGYTSFINPETMEEVPALEPVYEELEYYYYTFAESAGIPIIDYKMNEQLFAKLEKQALTRIEVEKEANAEALARLKDIEGVA